MRFTGACFLLIGSFLFAQAAVAQSLPIGDPFEQYLRVVNTGENQKDISSFNLRSIDPESLTEIKAPHPWEQTHFFNQPKKRLYAFYAPTLFTTYNSRFPAGQNDGAIWQGKGLNTAVSLGGTFRYGPLHISLRPQFGYNQNRDFELSPLPTASQVSEFGMPKPNYRLDNPQRFGDESFSWVHPGQSFARLQYKGLAAGVSTESFWAGPALYNPLMFSNNAPGFFHAFLGTYRPVNTPIGNIETRLFAGGVKESDYFDTNPGNNRRVLTGLIFNYSPSFAPGFHIGFTRSFMEYLPAEGVDQEQIFKPFEGTSQDNFSADGVNENNQMISIFGRWAIPDFGFEVWFEYGRNDNIRDSRDFIVHIDHARAYVLGALQRIDLSDNRFLMVNYEMTHLQVPRSVVGRTNGPYYQHTPIRQGWTNQGQILGAGINSGSNNQKLMSRFYDTWGMAGLSINRVEHLNDRLRRYFSTIRGYQTAEGVTFTEDNLREIEFRLGFHGVVFLPNNLELQGDIYQSFFRNRNNLYKN
ncbi:MAG: capsule assembly Wzi family protein, partial [Balneolaceae bacterium]